MFESIKWMLIRQLIKWNVLSVVPVRAQNARMPQRRRFRG